MYHGLKTVMADVDITDPDDKVPGELTNVVGSGCFKAIRPTL